MSSIEVAREQVSTVDESPYELLLARLKERKLPRLDGLRAASALFVVLFHYGYNFIPAGFGVMFFFVISGFLITWLLLKERDATGTVSLKKFYARRALRIFPAFYSFWIIITCMLLLGHYRIIWAQALSSFFYVANYYQGLHNYPSTPYSLTWSLAVEEQFYLLWPLAFLLFSKSPKRLASCMAAVIGAVWILRTALTLHGTAESYIYTAFEMRIDHLLVGCLCAVLLYYGLAEGLFRFLTSRAEMVLLTVALMTVSWVAAFQYGITYRDTIGFTLDPILMVILIIQLLAFERPWATWLDWRPIAYLGTISYATYLYHEPSLRIAEHAVSRLHLPLSFTLPIGLICVWIVASFSYWNIERPFLKLKDRLHAGVRPAESGQA